MKLAGVIGTAILTLSLGASSAAYAQEQHDQQEEQKDKPAEKKAQPEKPAKQDERNAQGEKNTKPEEKNAKQEQPRAPEGKPQQEAKPQQQREQHASGGRIPADRYKANFGREHTFRVSQGDYRSGRFQYGGYWFGFGGAWPGNWLYTQDVYVIEINGVYYLCNPMYPGVNLVLSVTL